MQRSLTILLAEDSDADADLMQAAIYQVSIHPSLFRVKDGREAVAYLEGYGPYADRIRFPFPDVLISDLKMPRMDGLQLLAWVQTHPRCSLIPAILLTGSNLREDVEAAYELGANTFFEKPHTFTDLVNLLKTLHSYWLRSELPALHQC